MKITKDELKELIKETLKELETEKTDKLEIDTTDDEIDKVLKEIANENDEDEKYYCSVCGAEVKKGDKECPNGHILVWE